jgi:hypothetical protein
MDFEEGHRCIVAIEGATLSNTVRKGFTIRMQSKPVAMRKRNPI